MATTAQVARFTRSDRLIMDTPPTRYPHTHAAHHARGTKTAGKVTPRLTTAHFVLPSVFLPIAGVTRPMNASPRATLGSRKARCPNSGLQRQALWGRIIAPWLSYSSGGLGGRAMTLLTAWVWKGYP